MLGREFSSVGEVLSSVTEWRVGWKSGIGRVEISSSTIISEKKEEIIGGKRIIDGKEVSIEVGEEKEKDDFSPKIPCLHFFFIDVLF
jgi:hypothetical protein